MTWTSLHAQVHQTLRRRFFLPPQQSILMAVSGGQDSLCLAQLLIDLQAHWGWRLGIGHCDHRWRPDSQANADHVAHLAATWHVEFHRAIAPPNLRGEAQAREWRYQALTEMAQLHRYSMVVTGHTAGDRAETLLYNLVRGSGSDGLQALAWQRPLAEGLTLVRPLLEIPRQVTARFCRARNLPVWEDSSNQDRSFARNRIRQELLPYLEEHFNPQVQLTLAQTAELLQAEVAYLEAQAQELVQLAQPSLDAPALQRHILQGAPLALQRRALRQFLQVHLPVAPNFAQVEKCVALLAAPNRSQTDPFPGGAIARIEDPWIVLALRSEKFA